MLKQLKVVGAIAVLTMAVSGCITGPVVAASAAGVGGANVAGSSITVPQQYDDLTIKSDIFTILNNMKGLNGANVEVTVFNGIVLLLGQVPTEYLKSQLANDVSQIQGVKIVYNQLTIGPNVTFTTFADDTWITSKVIGNMVGKVNPLHFKVVTQQGVVYLLGQVTSEEGEQAASIAQQTSGVKQVVKIFNYISPTQATPATVSAGQATSLNSTSTPTPAVASAPSSTASASENVTPVSNPSSIPQTAPTYETPGSEQVGPAASD